MTVPKYKEKGVERTLMTRLVKHANEILSVTLLEHARGLRSVRIDRSVLGKDSRWRKESFMLPAEAAETFGTTLVAVAKLARAAQS